MPKRAYAPALALLLLLPIACSRSGGTKSNAAVLKELHDPRAAPTATLPAAAPSPIPGSVPGVAGASGPLPDTYVVKSGDTLGGIATQLGVAVDDLARANNITDPTRIQVGQQLRVPRPGQGAAGAGASFGAGPTFGTSSATPGAGPSVPPTGGAPSGVGSTSATPTVRATAAATAVATAGASASAAAGATEYTVKAGDSACAIAIAHNVSLQELASANGMTKDQLVRLSVGQLLKIPAPTGNKGC